MKYKFTIEQDIYRDAWNWWNAANCTVHGVDWRKKIPSQVISHIKDKKQEDAYCYLIPLLKNKYATKKKSIDDYISWLNTNYNKFNKACTQLARVMNRQIYRNDFHFFLTTIGRSPYDKNTGSIWLPIYKKDVVLTFLHELCHFQFIHYWRENPNSSVAKLTEKQFEYLKESLTVILDKDFLLIAEAIDEGYKLHHEFRKKLHNKWAEEKDFDNLVEYGVNQVTKYI